MQRIQLLTIFLMSVSKLNQYTTLRAMDSIQLIPGCPECSCLRTAFLSLVGTTTWSTNIRQLSMMKMDSYHCLNFWMSFVRSRGYECWRNLQTFWITGSRHVSHFMSTFIIEIALIQSVNAHWKLSSMVMAVVRVSLATTYKLRRKEKASVLPNSVALQYCISKSYPNKMITQHCG